MAFLRSLSRTLFINSAKITLGQIKEYHSVLSTQTHLPQACPTPYLVIKSCSRKHHGHLIGPLGLILPLTHLMVPEMQTTWVTHQPVRKLPPDLRTEAHQQSIPSSHTAKQREWVWSNLNRYQQTDSGGSSFHKLRSECASEDVYLNRC